MIIAPRLFAPTAAAAANPAPSRPATLQELFDRTQSEIAQDEATLSAKQAREAKAQRWLIGGAASLITGMGVEAASAIPALSAAAKHTLLGAGIGLAITGMAIYAPSLWIRDSASFDADMLRTELPYKREHAEHLKEMLERQA